MVKKLKTTYHNEKQLSEIQKYIFEYVQNIDQVLAKFDKAKDIILKIKSQFYQAYINMRK